MPNADFVPSPGDDPLSGIKATGAIAQILQQKAQSDAALQMSAAQLQNAQLTGQQLQLENQKLQALQPFVTQQAQSQLGLTDAQTGNLIAQALNTSSVTAGQNIRNAFTPQLLSQQSQQGNQDLVASMMKNNNYQDQFNAAQGLTLAQTGNIQAETAGKTLANQSAEYEQQQIQQGTTEMNQMMPGLLKQAGISNIPQNVNAYAAKGVTALQQALSASKEQLARAGMFASHATEFNAQNDKMAQQIQLQRLDMISRLNPGQAAGFAATATDPTEKALAQATAADPGKSLDDQIAGMIQNENDPDQMMAGAMMLGVKSGFKPSIIPEGYDTKTSQTIPAHEDFSQYQKLLPAVKSIVDRARAAKQTTPTTPVAGQVAASVTPPAGTQVVKVTSPADAIALPSGTWYQKPDGTYGRRQ